MTIDLSQIVRNYAGLWVGLKKDTKIVVASGATIKEVVGKSKEKGVKDPVLFRVPSEIIPYVGQI